MIDLLEHDRTAYDSAVSLLSKTGKMAVIIKRTPVSESYSFDDVM